MKDKFKITKVEHVWSDSEDRWIYIEYNEHYKIIGLNFMQGSAYDHFKAKWCHNDRGLTEFYEAMVDTFAIEEASSDTIEFINKVMWAYHTAVSYKDQY